MNTIDSRPRLSRGTTEPHSADATLLGQIGPAIPLVAYLAGIANDTMCDHINDTHLQDAAGLGIDLGQTPPICDACQGNLYELGALIDHTAAAVSDYSGATRARLDAEMALAAAGRLLTLFKADTYGITLGRVKDLARGAIDAGHALLMTPDGTWGAHGSAHDFAIECEAADQEYYRTAKENQALDEAQFLVGFVLKAAGKAAESAVEAASAAWLIAGADSHVQAAENAAGAALGAALDGAKALLDTSVPSAVMAVALAAAATFDRFAHPELQHGDDEEMDDFDPAVMAEVADEAIGDLERAEAMLNAIANLHRPVEQCVRTSRETSPAGEVTEYYQNCCIVCRDVKGRPMPSPCTTMQILDGYGEA